MSLQHRREELQAGLLRHGTGQAGCAVGSVQTSPGTWSQVSQTVWVSSGSDVGPGCTYSPASLAHGIASGQWRVVGRHTQVATQEFAFLPPTSANLALLRVRIPPGYPRSVPER